MSPKGIVAIASIVGALILVSARWVPVNNSRHVGEEFVRALQAESDAEADTYLSADSEVYLQGASSPMSREQFQDYLNVLKRGKQTFRAASRVLVTDTGAGWMLDVKRLTDTVSVDQSGAQNPATLWMQARIEDNKITRLWIHFTVEALVGLHTTPEAYSARAGRMGIEVPEAWDAGTTAMFAAAERTDARYTGGWLDSTRQLVLAATAIVATLILCGASVAHRQRRGSVIPERRLPRGQMLARLRESVLARDALFERAS